MQRPVAFPDPRIPEGFESFLRPMITKALLGTSLGLFLAACATSGLHPLLLDGHELHVSLAPKQLDGANHGVPAGVRRNPHFSTDPEVVESIARNASQGQLGGDGISAALYALYQGESELGIYGLEAAPTVDADRLEGILRGIWAYNVGKDLARVHRGGPVFVVVWNDGVSPACWQAVNDCLVARLTAR
ncbi:MAG: hypothetical protein HZA53_06440 [Planctomycetes bacterium]|nr:hypothetical protein [Planctomycetota bacterium]